MAIPSSAAELGNWLPLSGQGIGVSNSMAGVMTATEYRAHMEDLQRRQAQYSALQQQGMYGGGGYDPYMQQAVTCPTSTTVVKCFTTAAPAQQSKKKKTAPKKLILLCGV